MPHRIRGVDARLSRYSYLVSLLANAPVGYQIEKRFSRRHRPRGGGHKMR
ncbi:MAG: hypothetical protein WKF73_07185 [Nocardioidaceae bacterium]